MDIDSFFLIQSMFLFVLHIGRKVCVCVHVCVFQSAHMGGEGVRLRVKTIYWMG